jgi:hypothetical protein
MLRPDEWRKNVGETGSKMKLTGSKNLPQVCSNPQPFYTIKSLLPAVRRRNQGPPESLLKSHHYENS